MSEGLLDKKRGAAIAYYDMKRYDQAAQVLTELLAEDPEDAFLLQLLANCHYMLDEYAEAERICMELIPTHLSGNAFRLLGKIYREKLEYRKAEQYFLKALEQNPQSGEALVEYAFLLLVCGYDKKANEVMREAERLDPDNSIVLHYKFFFKHSTGSKKEEKKAAVDYMKASGDEVQKLIKLGLMDYKNNRFKRAREYFRQAFLLDPSNEFILSNLKELDRISHFIFFPNRVNSRVHPLIRFIGFPLALVLVSVLLSLVNADFSTIFTAIALMAMILFNIWSRLSILIYKYLIKGE